MSLSFNLWVYSKTMSFLLTHIPQLHMLITEWSCTLLLVYHSAPMIGHCLTPKIMYGNWQSSNAIMYSNNEITWQLKSGGHMCCTGTDLWLWRLICTKNHSLTSSLNNGQCQTPPLTEQRRPLCRPLQRMIHRIIHWLRHWTTVTDKTKLCMVTDKAVMQ